MFQTLKRKQLVWAGLYLCGHEGITYSFLQSMTWHSLSSLPGVEIYSYFILEDQHQLTDFIIINHLTWRYAFRALPLTHFSD